MASHDPRPQPVNLPVGWRPDSWRERPATQLPSYPDDAALEQAIAELRALPPLVTSWEILSLKRQLAEAQEGKRFLLQGGDCAESFGDCSSAVVSNRLKVLLQMSLVLVHGLRLPVVRVGRFAGQYAKPRSTDTETRGRHHPAELPRRHGQRAGVRPAARTPDPRRMIKAHARSAMTMNFVRALIDGGFADLHHPEYWDLGWVGHSPLADEYHHMVAGIGDAVRFMETLSGSESPQPQSGRLLHLARGAAAALRGGIDPAGAAAVGLVQPQSPISRGSACAPRRSTARTWSTSAASATRWRSRSDRR
jgi:3-deoxy-7-phosphoheptulonate synthase